VELDEKERKKETGITEKNVRFFFYAFHLLTKKGCKKEAACGWLRGLPRFGSMAIAMYLVRMYLGAPLM
jgi:hypothetical protein